jgi:hypothetical protein
MILVRISAILIATLSLSVIPFDLVCQIGHDHFHSMLSISPYMIIVSNAVVKYPVNQVTDNLNRNQI